MSSFFSAMESSGLLGDLFYYLGGVDPFTFFVFLTLGAITCFRREMSCNRCYVEDRSTEIRVGERHEDDELSSRGDEDSNLPLVVDIDSATTTPPPFFSATLFENVRHVLLGLEDDVQAVLDHCNRGDNSDGVCVLTTEEMLDAAGFYLAGMPIVKSFFSSRPPSAIRVPRRPSSRHVGFLSTLPTDVQVQILSFLHPKDVSNVACVNKDCRALVEDEPAVWKTMWTRDYAWLIDSWDIGKMAKERSGCEPQFGKDFYFRFALCATNYLLAGQNSYERCLVGIGGHIYDLSLFLASHPGSPETVMAHAGQEATDFFARINHSVGARRIAKSLCVVVDLAFCDTDECGARPTKATFKSKEGVAEVVDPPTTYNSHTIVRRKGCLQNVREEFEAEEFAQREAMARLDIPNKLGGVNVYFDPLARRWKAWYTSNQLDQIFLDCNDQGT